VEMIFSAMKTISSMREEIFSEIKNVDLHLKMMFFVLEKIFFIEETILSSIETIFSAAEKIFFVVEKIFSTTESAMLGVLDSIFAVSKTMFLGTRNIVAVALKIISAEVKIVLLTEVLVDAAKMNGSDSLKIADNSNRPGSAPVLFEHHSARKGRGGKWPVCAICESLPYTSTAGSQRLRSTYAYDVFSYLRPAAGHTWPPQTSLAL